MTDWIELTIQTSEKLLHLQSNLYVFSLFLMAGALKVSVLVRVVVYTTHFCIAFWRYLNSTCQSFGGFYYDLLNSIDSLFHLHLEINFNEMLYFCENWFFSLWYTLYNEQIYDINRGRCGPKWMESQGTWRPPKIGTMIWKKKSNISQCWNFSPLGPCPHWLID